MGNGCGRYKMAKELHELNELEERVILVAVEMDERSSRSAMDTDA